MAIDLEDQSKLTYTKPLFVDLIGKPFVYGGRGPQVYDCWGLLMELHRRAYGIELPDYRSPGNIRDTALLMANSMERWERVEEGPGTTVLMSVQGVGAHVGFQVDEMRVVHTMEPNGGVLSERLSVWQRANKVIGHYRYVG